MPPTSTWHRLFLAMAHHRLGHGDLARQFIEKARAWIEEADRNERFYADRFQRVEFHALLREAEELLKARTTKSGT